MKRWNVVWALAAAVLLAAAPAFAQGGGASSTGSISGAVEDAQGGVLPGVTVTATSPAQIGVLTAVAGLVAAARTNGVTPGNMGIMRELHVITAVVIGGTSLTGGRASMVGTVIGALIFGTLSNGMNLMNVNSNWQLIFTGLILLGASMLGNVYLGRLPKVVPHVIEVDTLGEAAYRGPVGEGATFTPSEALVRYQLRRWIDLTRTISSDNVVLRKNWLDAYKMLTTRGTTLMNAWIQPEGGPNDPVKRAQQEVTAVEILSAVPQSAESWQIDWKETTWDKSGQMLGKPAVWRAVLKVVQQAPKTRQQMIDNPIGLFVDEFHWEPIQAARL